MEESAENMLAWPRLSSKAVSMTTNACASVPSEAAELHRLPAWLRPRRTTCFLIEASQANCDRCLDHRRVDVLHSVDRESANPEIVHRDCPFDDLPVPDMFRVEHLPEQQLVVFHNALETALVQRLTVRSDAPDPTSEQLRFGPEQLSNLGWMASIRGHTIVQKLLSVRGANEIVEGLRVMESQVDVHRFVLPQEIDLGAALLGRPVCSISGMS